MRLPSRPVCLLIGIHTCCLCLGFWFLCQIVVSSTEHDAAEGAWSELASNSEKLGEFVGTLTSADLTSDAPAQAELQSLSKNLSGASRKGVMLVNWDWVVVNPISASAVDEWKVGNRVTWQAEHRRDSVHENRRDSAPETNWGWLKTPTGNRVAVSHPVADTNAHLVVYDSEPLTPAWRQALLALLPLAAGVAFLWTWVLMSVATYLLSSRLHSEESHQKTQTEHDALRSAQDLLRTRDAVIFGLAKLAESRDPETGHHLERISLYSTRLANALRTLPKYQRVVTPGFIRLLGISSVLHDIGKVGLEDTVLLKPGRLTDEERKKMQQHTLVAGACLREIEQRLGASNFLQTAREIALHHHERWDGAGYPDGLAGEAIPLAARIVTVADVYDALASKRVYKEAFPHAECVQLIRDGAGTQFDPELVDVFLSIEPEFAAIARQFVANQRAAAELAATVAPPDASLMTPAQESVLLETVSHSKTCNETSGLSSSVA